MLRRHIWPFLAQADLPRIRLHDMRHTAATLLLGPVPTKVASEYLGHSTTGITENTYQRVLPGMQSQVAAVMDALLAVLDPSPSIDFATTE